MCVSMTWKSVFPARCPGDKSRRYTSLDMFGRSLKAKTDISSIHERVGKIRWQESPHTSSNLPELNETQHNLQRQRRKLWKAKHI